MNTTPALRTRAVRAVYRLHNSGRWTANTLRRLQRLADYAFRLGARELAVLCYANGNTNGR